MKQCYAYIALLMALLFVNGASAQTRLRGPQPGDIYREYSVTMSTGSNDWRVTDPNAGFNSNPPGNNPGDFLPNPTLNISIGDLVDATRAEVVIDLWGGHPGTQGKAMRFNGNSWISIPEMNGTNGIPSGHNGECYEQQLNATIDVPLSDLHEGNNTFQGTNTGQTCYSFDWGQHGWYGIVVRIYYSSNKAHPTGQITSPTSGSSISENATITASASSSAGIDRVDFVAYYDGYDTDGDGIFTDWQYNYHRKLNESSMIIHDHVGTATGSPYQVTWNAQWVPDQAPGAMKIAARIRDNNGLWYMTPAADNLTLSRSGVFVRLYKPENVPESFWVRDGQTKTSNVTIPASDDLGAATGAMLLVKTWDGLNAGDPDNHTRINGSWTTSNYGMAHFYSYDMLSFNPSNLHTGSNDIEFYSSTAEHGIEICWPGPAIVVRYNGVSTNDPPTVVTQPVNQTVGEGETATFTVAATGTAPFQYQWQKNGSDITSGGNNATYTTPPAVKADSGAAFRCIVSNTAGHDTSHAAYLSVGSFPPHVTVQPVSRTVRLGQTATFSVTATGSSPLTYQWQKNGSDITDATLSGYTTPPVALTDSGATFRCIVSNGVGHDTSHSAVLNVSSSVENLVLNGGFESGTENWTFYSSGSASFAADVAGPASAHAGHGMIATEGNNVQLFQAGIPLEQDTVYRLLFRAYSSTGHDVAVSVQKHGSPYTNYGLLSEVFDLGTGWARYSTQFKASGFTGVATDARLMFWIAPYDANGDEYFFDDVFLAPASQLIAPIVTTHPAAATVKEGEVASFTVAATGTGPLSYQWQKNGSDITGATGISYSTPVLGLSDNGTQYRCVVSNLVGTITTDAALLTVEPLVSVRDDGGSVPREYFLAQNHPNPFNPSTVIRFGLPQAGYVSLRVVNLLGQEVATLADGFMPAGQHAVTFHAERLPSGIYLYRMQAGNFISTKKLVLVK